MFIRHELHTTDKHNKDHVPYTGLNTWQDSLVSCWFQTHNTVLINCSSHFNTVAAGHLDTESWFSHKHLLNVLIWLYFTEIPTRRQIWNEYNRGITHRAQPWWVDTFRGNHSHPSPLSKPLLFPFLSLFPPSLQGDW
jgi:hypothetical protein